MKIHHLAYTPATGFSYAFFSVFPDAITRYADRMTEGDFLPLPFTGEDGQIEWSHFEWLQSAIDEPKIILFDEYHRATQEVKNQIEKLPGIVHKDTLIFTASSNGDMRGDGFPRWRDDAIKRRSSQMTEGDFIGIPFFGEDGQD